MAPDQRYCVECGERRGKSEILRRRAPEAANDPARREAVPRGSVRRVHRPDVDRGDRDAADRARRRRPDRKSGNSTPKSPPITVNAASGGGSKRCAPAVAAAAATRVPVQSTSTGSGSHPRLGTGSVRAPRHKGIRHDAKTTTKSSPRRRTSSKADAAANKAAQQALGTKSNIGSATSQPGASCTPGSPGCSAERQADEQPLRRRLSRRSAGHTDHDGDRPETRRAPRRPAPTVPAPPASRERASVPRADDRPGAAA